MKKDVQVKHISDAMVLKYVPYKGIGNPLRELHEQDGIPAKVALRKIESLIPQYLEFSVSVNWVYLTDEGWHYKRALEGLPPAEKPPYVPPMHEELMALVDQLVDSAAIQLAIRPPQTQ